MSPEVQTGVSVAPQKELMSSKYMLKKEVNLMHHNNVIKRLIEKNIFRLVHVNFHEKID